MQLPRIKEQVIIEGNSVSRLKKGFPLEQEVSDAKARAAAKQPRVEAELSHQKSIRRTATDGHKGSGLDSSEHGEGKAQFGKPQRDQDSNAGRLILDNSQFIIDIDGSGQQPASLLRKRDIGLQKSVGISKDYKPRQPDTGKPQGAPANSRSNSFGKNPHGQEKSSPVGLERAELDSISKGYLKAYIFQNTPQPIPEINRRDHKQKSFKIQQVLGLKEAAPMQAEVRQGPKEKSAGPQALSHPASTNTRTSSNHTPSPKLLDIKPLSLGSLNAIKADSLAPHPQEAAHRVAESYKRGEPRHPHKRVREDPGANRSLEEKTLIRSGLAEEAPEGLAPANSKRSKPRLQPPEERNYKTNPALLDRAAPRDTQNPGSMRRNADLLPQILNPARSALSPPERLIEATQVFPQARGRIRPSSAKAKKSAKPRKLDVLYNLYCGLSCQKEEGFQPRYGLGTGNNDKLLDKLFRAKGLAFENFFSKCNVVWTQLMNRRAALANTKQGVEEMDLNDENTPSTIRTFRIKNADALEAQILGARLFRAADPALVREVAQELKRKQRLVVLRLESFTILNHVSGLGYIAKKHLLFDTLRSYCREHGLDLGRLVPETWVLRGDTLEEDLQQLVAQKGASADQWSSPLILKPGENSNRGQGIAMAYSAAELKAACLGLIETRKNTSTLVVQTYMVDPLLFKNRKFDFRCYGLVHKLPGRLSYYWYSKGYARTCSFEYKLDTRDNLMVHLTNEAVQVKGTPRSADAKTFGKFEPGNKVYYAELADYFNSLDEFKSKQATFRENIVPQFKVLAAHRRVSRCSPSRPPQSTPTESAPESSASSCSASTS